MFHHSSRILTIFCAGASYCGAQIIDSPTITQAILLAGTPTPVTVSAKIDPQGRTILANSVTVVLREPSGAQRTLGVLADNGISPDTVAGDQVFSGRMTLSSANVGSGSLWVTAAVQGVLRRPTSPAVTLDFVEAIAVIGPTGGVVEITDPSSRAARTRLTVPSGALGSQILIGMSAAAPSIHKGMLAAGPAVRLVPSGLQFLSPALLEMGYGDVNDDGMLDGTDLSEEQVQAFTGATAGQVSELTIRQRYTHENRIVAEVGHFSIFFLACRLSDYTNFEFGVSEQALWQSIDSTYDPPASTIQQITYGVPFEDATESLRLISRGRGRDRIKVNSRDYFDYGAYTWRVRLPAFGVRDQASVGAFLYGKHPQRQCDPEHDAGSIAYCIEYDFEIGYGKVGDRTRVGATTVGDAVAFLTTQGGYRALTFQDTGVVRVDGTCMTPDGKCAAMVKVSANAWFYLTVSLRKVTPEIAEVSWWINGRRSFAVEVGYANIPLQIFNSVENLEFLGDAIPAGNTTAYFDHVTYYPTETLTSAGRIVFVRDGDAWMMDTEGDNEHALTSFGDVQQVRLSNGVVVYRRQDALYKLGLPDPIPNATNVSEYDLSPDGQSIVFTYGNNTSMYVMPVTGGTPILVSSGGHQNYPSWGRDGYIYYGQSQVGDALTQKLYRVLANASSVPETLVTEFSQYPSAGGPNNRVAYLAGADYTQRYIKTMNADGTGQTTVTGTPVGIYLPISQDYDNNTIYYQTLTEIWKIDTTTGTKTRLATNVYAAGVDYGKIP